MKIRPGTLDDTIAVYNVFQKSALDLGQRLGSMAITGGEDPAVLEKLWERRRPLFEHLAQTAEQFWLAEDEGHVIGYARSTLRDGLRELTEFFVLPGHQSAGVGRELLARAFPAEGAARRCIAASIDSRAVARYLKAGVYPLFPVYYFERQPEEDVSLASDLLAEPITDSEASLALLGELEAAIVGHRRDVDHRFLLGDRQGYFYRRGEQVVGYGYVGHRSGPFALLDSGLFPAVLAHAEHEVARSGETEFGLEVPLVNRVAVAYLLERGFKMDSFFEFFMADAPFGLFENYVFTSPPFFL